MRKRGKSGCPEKKNGVLTPLIMAPRAGKDVGGRGGPDEAMGKFELTEISGRGQKWNFGKVAEGV